MRGGRRCLRYRMGRVAAGAGLLLVERAAGGRELRDGPMVWVQLETVA